MTKLTQEFFKDNFESFKEQHLETTHYEIFYQNFYYETISNHSHLISDEEKQEWKEEWIESLEDDELSEMSFDEILEHEVYDFLGEDISEWVVNSDEPKFAELKEQFIQALFVEITNEWSEEAIQGSIDTIQANK